MCTWNQTPFLNQAQKFLNLKKCAKTKNHKVLKSQELGLKPKPMELIKTNFNLSKPRSKCCLKKKNKSTLIFT